MWLQKRFLMKHCLHVFVFTLMKHSLSSCVNFFDETLPACLCLHFDETLIKFFLSRCFTYSRYQANTCHWILHRNIPTVCTFLYLHTNTPHCLYLCLHFTQTLPTVCISVFTLHKHSPLFVSVFNSHKHSPLSVSLYSHKHSPLSVSLCLHTNTSNCLYFCLHVTQTLPTVCISLCLHFTQTLTLLFLSELCKNTCQFISLNFTWTPAILSCWRLHTEVKVTLTCWRPFPSCSLEWDEFRCCSTSSSRSLLFCSNSSARILILAACSSHTLYHITHIASHHLCSSKATPLHASWFWPPVHHTHCTTSHTLHHITFVVLKQLLCTHLDSGRLFITHIVPHHTHCITSPL